MKEQECGTCIAYSTMGDGSYGECRFNPPVLSAIFPIDTIRRLIDETDKSIDETGGWEELGALGKWPIVSYANWCLRWVKHPEADKYPNPYWLNEVEPK